MFAPHHLWENSRRRGAAFAFTGTPPSGQRGKGGEKARTSFGELAEVQAQLAGFGGMLSESLEAMRLGSLPGRATAALSQGKGSTESCSAGLQKRSRLVTTAFSE